MTTINYKGNSCATGVYAIKNLLNEKVYIGSTKRFFHTRKAKHLNSLRKGNHFNAHLQSAYNKYGEDNFVFEILIVCAPVDCDKWEGYYIQQYGSNIRVNGYNIKTVTSYKFEYKLSKAAVARRSADKKTKASTLDGTKTNERGINKKINLYSINGVLIAKFNSGIELHKKYGWSRGSISSCLAGRKLLLNKHILIFSNDTLTRHDLLYVQSKTPYTVDSLGDFIFTKEVDLYDLSDNFIRSFNSAKSAAIYIGCKDAEVRMCCIGRRSRIKSFKTKYSNGRKSAPIQ